MNLRSAETLSIVYFAYLTVVAVARGPASARSATLGALLAVTAGVTALAAAPPTWPGELLRAALPLGLLLLGYRTSGRFFQQPMVRLEETLLRIDRRLLTRVGLARPNALGPRAATQFELAYVLVYLLLPLGAIVLAAAGYWHVLDRFWTIVLAAGYACYGMLPWIQTRPPRLLHEQTPPADLVAVRRLNLFILARGSIGVNTVPSGHAATVVATALAVWHWVPIAGLAFSVLAVAVCVATVVGRYHYAVDTILGILVGALAAACGRY